MMKTCLFSFLFFMSIISATSQTKLYLYANGVTKTATLVKNDACAELVSLLENGALTLTMTENGGFEKVGTLSKSLTTSDVRQQAQPGDIMLYLGNVMCIFYGSNTWAYTKLGKLDDMSAEEIKEFLAGNPVEITLSIDNAAGIKETDASEIKTETVVDLNGRTVKQRPPGKGLYIINGKKTLIK